MSRAPHVAVVGGGIVGASIAWNLARLGMAVTVVADRAGGVASPASFGWINASWGNRPDYAAFRMAAMAEWRALSGELPDMPVTFGGGLLWDLPRSQLETFFAERAAQGYALRMVHRNEIAWLEPMLPDPPELALHAVDEGAAEPADAARMLLGQAASLGAVVIDAHADALLAAGDRVTAVATGEGEIHCDHVVVAAGTGTSGLLDSVGVMLPLVDPPGLLITTEAAPRGLVRGLMLAPDLHVRQRSDGRLVAGGDFGGSDPGADAEATALALHAALLRLLGARTPRLHAWTIGRRPTPADGHPMLGLVPGRAGLSVAVMHSGVTLAPLVGRLVAEEVASGAAGPSLAPWGLARLVGAETLTRVS